MSERAKEVASGTGVQAECKICALYLIRQCYERRWVFWLVREPLVAGMRVLAWANGLTAWKQMGRQPECRGCVRYLKAELEVSSATYRWLNGWIGPRFKEMRDSLLGAEEFARAKQLARQAEGERAER